MFSTPVVVCCIILTIWVNCNRSCEDGLCHVTCRLCEYINPHTTAHSNCCNFIHQMAEQARECCKDCRASLTTTPCCSVYNPTLNCLAVRTVSGFFKPRRSRSLAAV